MFTPRLTSAGMLNNPNWYSNNTFYNIVTNPPHLYGLPNCTCYCLGRWLELFQLNGSSEYPDTSLNNAYTWFTHSDRYERGQVAKLGAIACWKNTNVIEGEPLGSPGHVAIVEELFSDGGYKTSNSNFDAEYFITYNVDANNYFGDPNLEFMGFIYNPYVDGESKLNLILLNGLKRRKNNVKGKTVFGTSYKLRTRK